MADDYLCCILTVSTFSPSLFHFHIYSSIPVHPVEQSCPTLPWIYSSYLRAYEQKDFELAPLPLTAPHRAVVGCFTHTYTQSDLPNKPTNT